MRINPKTELELKVPFRQLKGSCTSSSLINNITISGFSKRGKRKTHVGILYGDDLVGYHVFDNTLQMAYVMDGHGFDGSNVTVRVCELLIKEIMKSLDSIKNSINSQEKLQTLFNIIYDAIDESLKLCSSGTTTSIVLIYNKKKIVSVNLGDSTIALMDKEINFLSKSCNWEDISEYKLFVENCLKKDIEPCPIVIGRYNLDFANIKNPYNAYEPFNMYKIDSNGNIEYDKLQIKTFVKQSKKFFKLVGGSQGLKKMTYQERVDDNWVDVEPYEGYEHTNWGSVLSLQQLGSIQISRVLGDKHLKRKYPLSNQPIIDIIDIEENYNGYLLIMSDGIYDAWYNHELLQFVNSYDGNNLSESIIDETINKLDLDFWDDGSIITLKIISSN